MISSVKQSVKQKPELLESRFSVAGSPLSRHIAALLVRSQREVSAGIVLDRPVLARTVSRLSSLHMSPISWLAPSITTARVRSALRTLPAAIGVMVLYAVIAVSLVEPVAAQSKPHQVTADSTASAPKQHQATGDVATSAPAQLVILKQFGRNKVRWTFVTSPKTKLDGKAAKGARVRIFYHEEKGQRVADRIKIMELAPGSSASADATASSSASRSVSPTKTAAAKSTAPKASTTKAAAPNAAALSPSASKTAALKAAAPKTTTPASKASPAPPSTSTTPPAPATQ
jgi:hypothetical protein